MATANGNTTIEARITREDSNISKGISELSCIVIAAAKISKIIL